jgi:endoglucanase
MPTLPPFLVFLPLLLCTFLLVGCIAPSTPTAAPAVSTFTFKRGVNISHWLSQNHAERPYGASWFSEQDMEWIARQGFDHVRIPVDGRRWTTSDGSLDDAKIQPFEDALRWARTHGLGTVLDMHFLPGASFDPTQQEAHLFTDLALQHHVADFWRRVALRFAHEGDYLRFEILNEPVAEENADLNPFNARMLAAIRESNPTRIVYITSNRWSSFTTVDELAVPDDPHVAITLHFYEPMVFTHQRASWVQFSPHMPTITFPGRAPDMTPYVPSDHWALRSSERELTVAEIDDAFAKVALWTHTHARGREIYIGEFGVYLPADAQSKINYVTAVRAAAERHDWGWAVWDYRGGFAVRDPQGEPTSILRGLFPR